ncbi:hypothetical protein SAMN05444920_101926 [Nonomuraea solani]|uniref:DUF8094 domain-containing protein n=1 Tax=Nonomuraea solani TaxID=1144553 RepID=A0A1H5VNN2_9ACTN|nr:hypothetical protein [Nonomuraea solani]SEF88498.1 hypothetical protein SAMN05444920_101926 [Nonomuraea solani]
MASYTLAIGIPETTMTMRRPTLALICLLALPACGAAERPPAVKAAPEPTGVVTVAEAGNVLKLWDQAVKQAESDGGADFAAAEAGPVMKISQINSALRKSLGERVETSHATMIKPRFAIPAKGTTRKPWFMAEFAREGERGWTQVIFARAAELYALRTAAGGALVWYAITLKETFTARTRTSRLNFDDPVAAATSHGRRYTKRATKSVSAIYLAVAPKNGKVRVPSELGAYLSITGS